MQTEMLHKEKDKMFEALMLLCFGFAWPISIYKSYTTKALGSKSLLFLAVIATGYASGIIHKITHSYNYVLWLYILNLTMVLVDIVLYVRNMRLQQSNSIPVTGLNLVDVETE
jgi:hypothetical protein